MFPGFYNGGWGGPEYTDWMDEQLSWKNSCYIGDWSFLWTATFKGPDAFGFLRGLTVNSFEDFAVGQAKHVINCNEYGKVVTEGICSVSEKTSSALRASGVVVRLPVRAGPPRRADDPPGHLQLPGAGAHVDSRHRESVRRERSRRALHAFQDHPHRWRGVLALRQGMAGEVGFELQGPAADGPNVHAAIMEAGQEYGIRRLGSRTAMINHLEACFPTSAYHFVMAVGGYDYSEAYNAYMVEHYHMPIMYSPTRGSFESDDIRDFHVSPIELGWA